MIAALAIALLAYPADDGASFGDCQCAKLAMQTEEPAPGGIAAATPSSFGLFLGGGVAIDKPAAALSVGGRYHFDATWSVGVDVEWNPWASIELKRFRSGSVNAYASVIRRYPVTDRVAVRTIADLGFSTLLFSLVGAPSGTTGAYVGVSLLGAEIQLTSRLRLMLDPAHISIPIPHITGVPIIYQQYRFGFGFQLDL